MTKMKMLDIYHDSSIAFKNIIDNYQMKMRRETQKRGFDIIEIIFKCNRWVMTNDYTKIIVNIDNMEYFKV